MSLAADIRKYIDDCRSRGLIPDAMAFSLIYLQKYGRLPGYVIERNITEELAKYDC